MTAKVTAEQMRELVVLGDRESLCAKLDTLDEKQRQSLANDAIAIAAPINEGWGPSGLQEERISDDSDGSRKALLQKLGNQKYVDWRVPRWTANLLVAGLCGQKVFLKPWDFGLSWLREDLVDMPERLLQILLARNPKWLTGWLEKEWKQEKPIPNGYVEEGLIKAGFIDVPPSEAHLNRLGDDTMDRYRSDASKTDKFRGQRRTIKQKFESAPEWWGRRIWSIFEYDTTITRYSFKNWGDALRELSLEGKLDRKELLHRSLIGMSLPLSPLTLTGMGKLHQLLAPTIQEQEQLQTEYLRLLGAIESSVMSLALATCDNLLKAKQLNGVAFFDALPAVFRSDKKTPPMKALSITKKLIKQDKSLETHATEAVAEGLRHVNTDVQAACLKLLTSLPSSITSKARSSVTTLRESVAPSLQSEVDRLLEVDCAVQESPDASCDSKRTAAPPSSSTADTDSTNTAAKTNRGSDDSGSLSDLIKQAAELPKQIQISARISAAIEQLQAGGPLTIEALQPHEIPRRDPSRQVASVESVEELIELVATTIESIQDVMDLERILDGISRFRAEPPAKNDKRTAALKKRIAKLSEPYTGKFLDQATNIGFTQLLMTWLDMPVSDPGRSGHWYTMRGWFLRERISCVTECIADSRDEDRPKQEVSMPLLAMPTHAGGWIDPVILVQRINEHYAKHRKLINKYDLAQALLRLMPDGRSDALARLGKPDRHGGDHYNGGSLLRYALGDSCELKSFGGWGSEAAMVAAVRARQVDEPVATPAYPISRASYRSDQSIAVEGSLTEDPTVPFSLAEKALSIEPFCTRAIDPDDRNSWLETWESLTNPFDTQASCMAGHLGHLLDPEATWTYAACRLFFVAASDDRGENRVLATDGLMEGISRSLISPQSLGQAFADTLSFIKLNRVSKVLGDVYEESNLHRWVVAEAIEHALSLLDEFPKNIHLLLSLLLEAKTFLGLPIGEPAAKKLNEVSGSSKTGKLAKQLLALATVEACYDELNAALLATLLERGERWRDLSRVAITRSK